MEPCSARKTLSLRTCEAVVSESFRSVREVGTVFTSLSLHVQELVWVTLANTGIVISGGGSRLDEVAIVTDLAESYSAAFLTASDVATCALFVFLSRHQINGNFSIGAESHAANAV